MSKTDTIDPGLVKELADMLSKSDLSEIEIEKGDLRIRVARQLMAAPQAVYAAQPAAAVPAPAATAAPAAQPAAVHPGTVKSPMVGTAYRKPSPDAKPLVEIGAAVKAGDRVLLIEAMKTFNDIAAPRAGTVTQILVEDGQPVEFGQPLFIIE